jgi:hypothetical protein
MTLHHLLAQAAGFAMSCREFRRWKTSSPTSDSPSQAALRTALSKEKDRPLTTQEAKGLRVKRTLQAQASRIQPARIGHAVPTISMVSVAEGHERLSGRYASSAEEAGVKGYKMIEPWTDGELTVPYYRRAMARFERWARSAERRGLDKSAPPSHVARKAIDVTQMTQVQAQ